MKILEVYLECGGYDYQLIKGGISVYTWNLSKAMVTQGEDVSILTAMHGQQEYLTNKHQLVELDYCRTWEMEIDADPNVWGNSEPIKLSLTTKAYRLDKDGISIYILSNDILDLYPDTYYPPYDSKGKDLGFFKPLVFQAETIHFIRHFFVNEKLTIHAHEPYYQYLIPAAFYDDPQKRVISTVQSNMPINKKVYLPKVVSLFRQLDVNVNLDYLTEQVEQTQFNQCLSEYLPMTHLNYPYPDNYVNLFALCVKYSDLVDFLSEGHLEFYSQFSGTAFRPLYEQLQISKLVKHNQHKFFVGGCAISDNWLKEDFSVFERDFILSDLGLNPVLPTFFHNARYAPNHKGQVEMIQAIEAFLNNGLFGNFILRCVSGTGIPDERFHRLVESFPNNVVLKWQMESESDLMAMAAASDFALFPSKFEMDTFLIAVGEAMLAGCVPIASEQLGMKHWHHSTKFSQEKPSTGFAVHRSFKEEDQQLVESISNALLEALKLFQQTERYQQKSQYAREHAQQFTWQNAAKLHLNAMRQLEMLRPQQGVDEIVPNGWLEQALHFGQLLQSRSEQQVKNLPKLHINNGQIEYHLPDAISVSVFTKQNSNYQSLELERTSTKASFIGKISKDIKECFLLVTMQNGDQFWDGFEAGSI